MGFFDTLASLDAIGDREDKIADKSVIDFAKLNLAIEESKRKRELQEETSARADRSEARAERRAEIAEFKFEDHQNTQIKQTLSNQYQVYATTLGDKALSLEELEGTKEAVSDEDTKDIIDKKLGFIGTFNKMHSENLDKYKDNPEVLEYVKLAGTGVQEAYDLTHRYEVAENDLIKVANTIRNSHKQGSAANPIDIEKILTNLRSKEATALDQGLTEIHKGFGLIIDEAERQKLVMGVLDYHAEDLKSDDFETDSPRLHDALSRIKHHADRGEWEEAERLSKGLHGDESADQTYEIRQDKLTAKSIQELLEAEEENTRKEVLGHHVAMKTAIDDVIQSEQQDDGGTLNVYYEPLAQFEGVLSEMDNKVNWDSNVVRSNLDDLYRGIIDAQIHEEEEGGKLFGGEWGVKIFSHYDERLKTEAQNNLTTAALLQSGWVQPQKKKDATGRENPVLVWNVDGRNVPKGETHLIYSQYDEKEGKYVVKNPLSEMVFPINNKLRRESIKEFKYADRSGWIGAGDNSTLQNAMANAAMAYLKMTPEWKRAKTIAPKIAKSASNKKTREQNIKDLWDIADKDDIKKQIRKATEDGVFDVRERQDIIESIEKIGETDVKKVLDMLESDKLLSAEDKKKFENTWTDWFGKSDEDKKAMLALSEEQAREENKITIIQGNADKMDFRRKYGNKMSPAERTKFNKDGIIPTRFVDIYNKER